MKAIEFGKEHDKVIMLLHGGGLSWWNFREEARLLSQSYHVLLPVLDGHADNDIPFLSVEESAREIIEFIDYEYEGGILAISGLSLGAQILIEMLSQRRDICQYAMVESALIVKMPMTNAMIAPMIKMSFGLICKKWFSKLQFDSLRIQKDLFEDYYNDTCKINQENMIRFLKANTSYQIKSQLRDTTAVVTIIVGGKEQKKMIQSARILNNMISGSTLMILDGYVHGELSLNHAENYVNLFEDMMQ